MDKRARARVKTAVWDYLQRNLAEAYEAKDELDFDWYSDGSQAYWCILLEKPIEITPRVKPLGEF
jgi:hypothetical protein